jgi:predicted  nucleic acid-binding Zn-ribbon protein
MRITSVTDDNISWISSERCGSAIGTQDHVSFEALINNGKWELIQTVDLSGLSWIAHLNKTITEAQETIANYKAMKEGVTERIADLEQDLADARAYITTLQNEMTAVAKATGTYVVCREGGGPENVAGTLALSVARLKYEYDALKKARDEDVLRFMGERDDARDALNESIKLRMELLDQIRAITDL